ncbi:hypothetical protein EGW08_006149, partial [Elysia chlorotica]
TRQAAVVFFYTYEVLNDFLLFFFIFCNSSSSRSDISTEKSEIISLISVNNHLQTTDHSRPPPETSTEKRIAQAIKEGDFSSAEAMSDRLATLEAGEKVAAAFDAKRFLQQKEKKKQTKQRKRRNLIGDLKPSSDGRLKETCELVKLYAAWNHTSRNLLIFF